jgi:hypothetical protein
MTDGHSPREAPCRWQAKWPQAAELTATGGRKMDFGGVLGKRPSVSTLMTANSHHIAVLDVKRENLLMAPSNRRDGRKIGLPDARRPINRS